MYTAVWLLSIYVTVVLSIVCRERNMDNITLGKICKNDSVVTRIFDGVYALDTIPTRLIAPVALIVNTDPINEMGEHWIAMYIDSQYRGEYFDSFAMQPTPYFVNYMNNNCTEWIYNNKCLQNAFTSTCGQYCLFYLYYRCRGKSMSEILNMFTSNYVRNDESVIKFVRNKYNVKTKLVDTSFIIDKLSEIN